ncbi:MAG: twin-arginine translocase TatA/TatE family subunit, partial [Actinomycetota bacterium]
MSFPGGGELLVVLLIILVLFGASRLPKLARSMGQA